MGLIVRMTASLKTINVGRTASWKCSRKKNGKLFFTVVPKVKLSKYFILVVNLSKMHLRIAFFGVMCQYLSDRRCATKLYR